MSVRIRLLALVLAAGCAASLASLGRPPRAQGGSHGRATSGMDCGVCHSPAGWKLRDGLKSAQGFDHDRTGFPLRAAHAHAACTACHDGRTRIERACSSCHLDAHGGRLGQRCDRCHTATTFGRTDAFAIHSQTRLPLTGMHVLVDCADCHRNSSAGGGRASAPSQCFACHEADYRRPGLHPTHDGSRGEPPFPRDCATCHRTDAFAPAVIDRDRFLGAASQALALAPRDHDRHFVISRGPHRGAACASCHVQPSAPRLTRCTGCHAHGQAALSAQHPALGAPAEGSCLGCHAGGFAR